MSTKSCRRSFANPCSSLTVIGLSHLGHLGWRTDIVAIISLLAPTQVNGDGARSRWPQARAGRHASKAIATSRSQTWSAHQAGIGRCHKSHEEAPTSTVRDDLLDLTATILR
ncbi:unnamed protein product [Cercospora beticola]|nr:unnamed protein product [Cercospora beticola]